MAMKDGVMTMASPRQGPDDRTRQEASSWRRADKSSDDVRPQGSVQAGRQGPVTLEFERAGKVTLSLDVQGGRCAAPAGGRRCTIIPDEDVRPKMPKKGIVVAAVLLATSRQAPISRWENKQAAIARPPGGIRRAAWLRWLRHRPSCACGFRKA